MICSVSSFVIHGYISLSGLISFLIVQNFENKSHPNAHRKVSRISVANSEFSWNFWPMRKSLASFLFWRNNSNKIPKFIVIFVSYYFFLGFYQQCNLKRHMASHNTPQDGAEGFKCSHCFASFTTKSGAKYLFFSPLVLSKWEKNILVLLS